jgi:predicted GNAT family N-acyltransferase
MLGRVGCNAAHRSVRAGKGLLHRYLEKMTGYGRARVTRLIAQYHSGSEVKPKL